MPTNPLLAPWTGNADLPPFGAITPSHFRPAYDAEMAAQLAAVDAVAENTEPATFANTIVPLEKSALGLSRVDAVFGHLTGADTNPRLQEVEREMAPILSQHWDKIFLNDALFRR